MLFLWFGIELVCLLFADSLLMYMFVVLFYLNLLFVLMMVWFVMLVRVCLVLVISVCMFDVCFGWGCYGFYVLGIGCLRIWYEIADLFVNIICWLFYLICRDLIDLCCLSLVCFRVGMFDLFDVRLLFWGFYCNLGFALDFS